MPSGCLERRPRQDHPAAPRESPRLRHQPPVRRPPAPRPPPRRPQRPSSSAIST